MVLHDKLKDVILDVFKKYYVPSEENEPVVPVWKIKSVYFAPHPEYSTGCIWFKLEKTSLITVSSRHLRLFLPKSAVERCWLNILSASLRYYVADQALLWKSKNSKCFRCHTTSKLTTDHLISFVTIKSKWLKSLPNGGKLEDTLKYNTKSFLFELDHDLSQRWREFHKKEAKYQTLCTSCHDKKNRSNPKTNKNRK